MLSAADLNADASVLRPGISLDVPRRIVFPFAPAAAISFLAASRFVTGSGRAFHAFWKTLRPYPQVPGFARVRGSWPDPR